MAADRTQNELKAVRSRKANGNRIVFAILAVCGLFAAIFLFDGNVTHSSAQSPNSSCLTCHAGLEGKLGEPAKLFENDIHKARNLSCHDCHGGNPNSPDKLGAKDRNWGYVAKPSPQQMPGFCGKCHSDAKLMKTFNPSQRVDQVQEYFTSIHGQRLQGGDQRVATCVSCHGVHGIRSPSDPLSQVYPLNVAETCAKCHASAEHMAGYGIPNDQFAKYRTSVHAAALYDRKDLSAPTCNDCHGNHGAVPPGVSSVANVCGQCHGRQAELFQKSAHAKPFEQLQKGECLRCHNNHDIMPPNDALTGIGQGSVCVQCHTNDKGFEAARRIGEGLASLHGNIERSKEILESAEQAGMEVSRPLFELKDATDGLTQARVLVHTGSAEEVLGALAPGMDVAVKTYQAGENAFAELSFRRQGLIVSLVFILFLAGLVYLKVRQIEGRYPFERPE